MSASSQRVLFNFDDIYFYKWSDLGYIEIDIKVGIHAFETLNLNQEKSLNEIKNNFEAKIEELSDSSSDELRSDYHSHFYESEGRMIDELKRQQRYALVLSIFSFFEGRLKEICHHIDKEFGFKVKVDDFGGSDDFRRYWNYLTKVYELDASSVESYFNDFSQQKFFRNRIAHHDGYITEGQKGNIHTFLGLEIIQANNTMYVEIRDLSFITYLLEKMDVFFKELLIVVDKRYKVLKN